MTSPPTQREPNYIITESQLDHFGDYIEDDENRTESKYKNARGLAAKIRSRPAPPEPTQPTTDDEIYSQMLENMADPRWMEEHDIALRQQWEKEGRNCDYCNRCIESERERAKAEERERWHSELNRFVDISEITIPDEESEEANDMVYSGELRAVIETLRTSTFANTGGEERK